MNADIMAEIRALQTKIFENEAKTKVKLLISSDLKSTNLELFEWFQRTFPKLSWKQIRDQWTNSWLVHSKQSRSPVVKINTSTPQTYHHNTQVSKLNSQLHFPNLIFSKSKNPIHPIFPHNIFPTLIFLIKPFPTLNFQKYSQSSISPSNPSLTLSSSESLKTINSTLSSFACSLEVLGEDINDIKEEFEEGLNGKVSKTELQGAVSNVSIDMM